MAELKLGSRGDVLQALGLGSCIGLLLADKLTHTGGMVHIMLPHSETARGHEFPKGKFANTGVEELLKQVLANGANKTRLMVKIAGGAEMFSMPGGDGPRLAVGARNIEAVKAELKRLGLRLDSEHTGGSSGRTFEADMDSLNCTLKMVGKGSIEF
jgi:chemotaxis protein CheD